MVDEEPKQWIIFLCHSEEDEPCAQWLYRRLHSMNISVWFEPNEGLIGDSRLQRIAEGLQYSLFLLVVISQHSIASPWVRVELEPRIIQQVDESKTIIMPVTLDGTSPEAVSPFLKKRYWIHIPCEGSEERFAELIRQLRQQLERQGRSDLAASIVEAPAPPTSRYPYGLVGDVQPDRFIVPDVTVNKITEYLVEGLSVSLVGARMIGKTSLLNFLSSEYYQRYYWQVFLNPDSRYLEYSQRLNGLLSTMRFVNIDMQEYVTEGATALMLRLASSISQGIKKECKENTYQGGTQWMRRHIEKRSTRKGPFWIVLLDNFDSIERFNEIPATFFDDLHNLGYRYRLCYVVASHRDVKELSQLKAIKSFKDSSFFTMFKKYTMGVWDKATATKLILSPYGTMTDFFNDKDASLIMQLTARHPRLLQLACEQLLEMSDKGERKDLEQFFRLYHTEADAVYARYWDYEITRKEREWLKKCWKALSQTGTRAKDEIRALIAGEENQQILEKMRKLGLILKRSGDSERAEQSNIPKQLLEDIDAITFSDGFATFLIRHL